MLNTTCITQNCIDAYNTITLLIYKYILKSKYITGQQFLANKHIFNLKNKLLSTKEYLEKQQYFKIIYYLENDFVKALGFTTPLLNDIGVTNLKEIAVD